LAQSNYDPSALFATAFAPDVEAKAIEEDQRRKASLSDSIPDVIEHIKGSSMLASKKEKVITLLNLYMTGLNYPEMQSKTGISKGAISEFLHEAQDLSKINFLPVKRSIKQLVTDVTRVERTFGLRAASKYDFHALRTTFVTLALSAGISVEILKALTGHATVEIVMRHYFKPKGSDFADQLTQAMPKVLTAPSTEDKAFKAAKPVKVIPKKIAAVVKTVRKWSDEERALVKSLI
jgi:hypothetical protein